jgi:hypothetical protein
MTTKNNYRAYLSTYEGRTLTTKHSLSDIGTWHIRGEDPNCDMGGPHSQPHLGYAKGKLSDVINMAVDIPHFFTWGAGGTITKIEPVLDASSEANQERARLRARKMQLEAELESISVSLGEKS